MTSPLSKVASADAAAAFPGKAASVKAPFLSYPTANAAASVGQSLVHRFRELRPTAAASSTVWQDKKRAFDAAL